jgi:beta-aspartyl-peptidase (threonine type)
MECRAHLMQRTRTANPEEPEMPAIPAFVRMFASWLLLATALAACAAAPPRPTATGDGYVEYAIGDASAPTPGRVQPGLMLVGGGDWPHDAVRWMSERMGHGRLVILRASGDVEAQEEWYRDIGGIASARTFVFSDRSASSDPVVLDALRKADGIFIAGGDQANYVRFWKDTPVAQALDAHVRAGKPLGGTSAGLAILGAWGYGALDGGSMVSEDALRDPLNPGMTLVDGFLHMPFLEHVITDTHFGVRERLGRLVAFVADIRARGDAGIVGLGVDQDAALCVDGDGIGRLFSGVPGGAASLVVPRVPPARLEAGKPLEISGVDVTGVGVDSRIDLKTMKVDGPAFRRIVDAHDGKLRIRDAGPAPAAR